MRIVAPIASSPGSKRFSSVVCPISATLAAVRYLKVLNRMFKGDWHLTLASYNGGPGTVQRAIKRRGVADFWTLAAKGRYLPRETRDYVPMVLAAMVVARTTPSEPPNVRSPKCALTMAIAPP